MKRSLAILIAAASIITGVDAYGISTMEVCQGPNRTSEDLKRSHKAYLKRESLGKKRQASLLKWLSTAPDEDIREIWGEPTLHEGRYAWVVQLEKAPIVAPAIHFKNDRPCFFYDETHRQSFVFVEFEDSKSSREIYTRVRVHP